MLNLLPFRNAHGIEHLNQPLGAEQSHQVILQGDIELGFTGVSLTPGTSAQLIVDTPGLMALRADNL